jgi:hypothetical protein
MNIFQIRLKYCLLSVVVNFAAILPITYGADTAMNDGGDSATPQRSLAVNTATSVEATPGQSIAQLQAEVFTKKRFIEVFGEESFNVLLKILDSDSVNGLKSFHMLSDASIAYDNPRKHNLMRRIKVWLITYPGTRSNEYLLLLDDFMRLDTIITTVPYNPY